MIKSYDVTKKWKYTNGTKGTRWQAKEKRKKMGCAQKKGGENCDKTIAKMT